MILRICLSVADSKANVFAPRVLPRGPHLGPQPLDITDRNRALRERRELAAKLEAAQQEERRRIARDIHNELVQLLAGVAIDLGGFVAHPPDSARGTGRRARALQRQVVRAAEMARSIPHRLYLSELDDLGLAAALHALCEDFARRENMTGDTHPTGATARVTRASNLETTDVGFIMQMWMALIWLPCGYGKRSGLKSCKRLGKRLVSHPPTSEHSRPNTNPCR